MTLHYESPHICGLVSSGLRNDLVLASPYITKPSSISLPTRRTLIMLMTIRLDVKYIISPFNWYIAMIAL